MKYIATPALLLLTILSFIFFCSKEGNANWNVNKNKNVNSNGRQRHRDMYNRKRHKQSSPEDTTPDEEQEEMASEEASTNCVTSSKKNQRYSSSFYENTTDEALTVEQEFHDVVGNNSKVKKSSSVHDGEDITLCWIETTTIKEDKTVRPSKKLVIREYTISFENSATIPERYLECKRYEGELTANDPEIGKTALFEVIDEDTMVSRIVNFTSVSHINNITVWQHKKVKCGVGPVVSKNIIELNDGSKNPKKRVEIRVSPKMHQLMATTTDEEPCTDSSTEYTTELSCENDVCETSTIPSISKNDEISVTEETVTQLQSETESESEEEHSLPTLTKLLPEEVSRRSTMFPKLSTTEKTDCEENSSDPACLTLKRDTDSSRELFPDVSTASTTEEKERKKVISDLVTEKTIPSTIVTDYSMETSEIYAPHPISRTSVEHEDSIASEISYEIKERSEEDQSFIELSREQVEKVSSSSTEVVTSGEVESDVTTEIPEFTEFTKEPEKPGPRSSEELSDLSILSENVTEIVRTEIIGSLSRSEEISSEELQEERTSTIRETTSVTTEASSEEEESISKTISTLPKTSSISSEVRFSCENSEECGYSTSSEVCDESGKCGQTTKCDSEGCSTEEVTDDQSKFDISSPSMVTKVPPFTIDSQSSEMTETQYTTVANVATAILTSEEIENAVNIPTMADTRRSTTTSTTPRHKLTLKVKVLLEHINENKQKQNLVEVEKHLTLDENPESHDNPDLLQQLKSLNDSVNVETISALLNCTSLGNLTKNSNFKLDDDDDSLEQMELVNSVHSVHEDSISQSEQFASVDAKNDYSEYEEHVVSSRKRRRRSLDVMEKLNRVVRQNLDDSTDSTVDSFNTSQSQTEVIKELSTTANHSEEETTTENLRNVTTEEGENTMSSTIGQRIDLLNASDSYNTNLTKEDIQLITTTINPEEENSTISSYGISIESEKNITNEKNESVVPLARQDITNETEMEVMQKTLSGIQEDVVVGLQHMVSQLEHNNMTTLNNVKETIKIGLLDILADPKETRIYSRRRRAAMEEVGHWSNERIKEASVGGNFRSFTEFTLYKVVS